MSDVIQLLPDSVANQIAAGEVIQRPASVIKELVENAVDAGAKHIQVQVIDAGRTLIQVIDDGKGMSETDARLAFERHATSKIRKADDLFALHTMGFRGEALPSVAAVAQIELTTRTKDEEIGTKIIIEGTRVKSQEPVACPVGANFRVENLFFNVPARRRFLKTNATELANIMTAFERIVLVYPDIHFTLYSNSQEQLNLKTGSLRQRIVDVFGKRLNQDLLPVDVETSLCRITGFVGKPESARKKGAHNYFFVNGRFMKHAYFHKAVTGAFERLVPQGMQVPYFIYFEVNPADIDVNIHPTKTEIKFDNEQTIWQILSAAVKDAIGRFCEAPAIDFDTEGRPDIPVFDPTRNAVEMPHVSYNPSYNPFKQTSRPGAETQAVNDYERKRPIEQWETLYEGAMTVNVPQQTAFFDDALPQQAAFFDDSLTEGTPLETAAPAHLLVDKSPAHYQYKGRYIMTAVRSGLMIIDQHRADVRIRYERYLTQLQQQQGNSQRLLFPEILQLSPSEDVVMQRLLPILANVGFDLSDLGGNSYSIGGLPSEMEGMNPVELVRNMVSDALELGSASVEQLYSTLALCLARHAAIPQGQVLSNDEMEQVVSLLFACSNVNYTPDGKAILHILPQRDIEQMLG